MMMEKGKQQLQRNLSQRRTQMAKELNISRASIQRIFKVVLHERR